MAYQAGTASNQTDLMSKLNTFAAANGFTVDNYDGTNRFLSISRPTDNLYMTFYWDGTNNIALYQALGYSGTYAQQPWNQANDSGNGNSNISQIYSGRNVNNIGAGPYTAYYFFAYTNPHAIYVVLEFSAGLYRHFGFGKLDKESSWTGGAFVYGHHWNAQNGGALLDDPDSGNHSLHLDGQYTGTYSSYGYCINSQATIHVESLPGQTSGGKWGVFCQPGSSYALTDRASVDREKIVGGCRGGVALSQYGHLLPDKAKGFLPIIPFECYYFLEATSDTWYYLGRPPAVGHIHLHGIDPAEELLVGSDTWVAFPGVRKAKIGGNNQESWNMGLIYRKDT